MKRELRSPFFVVNPKCYLWGEEAYKLAAVAEELAVKYDFDIIFTGSLVDLSKLAKDFPHLIICAQDMDALRPGKGMGHILPEALKNVGVQATFLNHAENPKTVSELTETIARAKELGILTIVCADDVADAKAIAQLEPDVMVCELKSLIGTGKTADISYMRATNEAVKKVSPKTKALQAAGISSGDDVYKAISSGADGTGGTSGIVAAEDPEAILREMIAALDRARTDFYK
ncbi:MAG: triose-phosphate isomerase [Erysipelotrichaceae bacterium]|jgi:triosephosphate isomerase